MPAIAPQIAIDEHVLAENLAALGGRSSVVAQQVQAAEAHPGARFDATDDGALAVSLGGVALCSKRRPLEEGERFAGRIDFEKAGGIVVLGFGAGHHVRALQERSKGASTVIVFEPDVALLRAVLERIDCSAWLRKGMVHVVTDADDARQLSSCIKGAEPFLSIGIDIVEHPASRRRLGAAAARFSQRLTDAVAAMRTSVVTTLVQSDVTLRNQLMNVDHYVTRPGINDLAGVAQGAPAVIVSAGPSLQRNLHLLEDPAIQERLVIVAVQTMLKPLLERGIRPHFVTALDHHEISKRFYEGLTAKDVEGVTLIIEAKANPAIPDSFPGMVRFAGDTKLDQLLGEAVLGAERKAPIKPGATVAHLAYYIARFVGCDPVILIGQDLGFTDGQYYADGASIHNVWACELNAFRTLEMFEWERIARGRRHLREMKDHLGRAIYSDAQMETYLAHFESDFARDTDAGLCIIDATEGGVRKRGTEVMPLQEALDAHVQSPLAVDLRANAALPEGTKRIEHARSRMKTLLREVKEVARLSRETASLLQSIDTTDQAKTNKLVRRVHANRDRVEMLEGGYTLVRHLNQAGALKRFKADRPLMLAGDELSPIERQQRQIDRDAVNVTWVAEAADVAAVLLRDAESALRGEPKRTRDPAFDEGGVKVTDGHTAARKLQCPAVLCITSMDDAARDVDGAPALVRTIERFRDARFVHRVVVLARDAKDADRARAMTTGCNAEIVVPALDDADQQCDHEWGQRMARARRWARQCWRGGIGGASCFDETYLPQMLRAYLAERDAPAALLCGVDWDRIDPALCDEMIVRFAEQPERHPIVFSQAAPGLGSCVVGCDLVMKLADAARSGARFASLGGLLGYLPSEPMPDPIARPTCVHVDPAVRDAALADMNARQVDELVIEVVGRTRPAQGLCAAWYPDAARGEMTLCCFTDIVRAAVKENPDIALTLAGPGGAAIAGDPVDHEVFSTFVETARELGVRWLHVRTSGRAERHEDACEALAMCDVVSVDVLAHSDALADEITGKRGLECVHKRMRDLHDAMAARDGAAVRWIVPRITRCDAAYQEIEPFYDSWINTLGAAMIDPLPRAIEGERIAPLTLPALAMKWRALVRHVRPDGSVAGKPA